MARKPKNQPITAAAALPAEKVAAIIETLAPARRGRKAAPAALAALPQDNAGKQGPKPHRAKAKAKPDPVEDGVPVSEALPPAGSAAGGEPAPQAAAPDQAGGDAHHPLSDLEAPSPVQPAAHWDRATGAVQFDWPAIEQVAAHEDANQGMAKLLIAARAEGANSRWPL